MIVADRRDARKPVAVRRDRRPEADTLQGMSTSSDIEADAETEVDVDEVLAHVGHGPAHHHHASGLVGRISLGLVDMSMR